jgi:hypothetical protein
MNEEILDLLIKIIDRKIEGAISSHNANYYNSEKQFRQTEELKAEIIKAIKNTHNAELTRAHD